MAAAMCIILTGLGTILRMTGSPRCTFQAWALMAAPANKRPERRLPPGPGLTERIVRLSGRPNHAAEPLAREASRAVVQQHMTARTVVIRYDGYLSAERMSTGFFRAST